LRYIKDIFDIVKLPYFRDRGSTRMYVQYQPPNSIAPFPFDSAIFFFSIFKKNTFPLPLLHSYPLSDIKLRAPCPTWKQSAIS